MERIKINLPEKFSFHTHLAIRVTDLNYAGHVGNDVFLQLAHEARQQFLIQHGYTELQFDGCGLIISDAAIEFKKELNYGDVVRISVAATGFDKYSFDFFYKLEIVKGGEAVLAGKAKTGMLCYDYANKKLVAVPGRARERLSVVM